MRRNISLKLRFNSISLITLLLIYIVISEVFFNIQKKTFINNINNELNYKLEHLITYLDFNNQIKIIKKRRPEFDDEVYNNYKKYIQNKSLPGKGIILVFNKKGDLLIHPTDEGKNVSQDFHINKILSSNLKDNSFFFNDPRDLRKKFVKYAYNDKFNIYVCMIIDWNNALAPVIKIRELLYIIFLLSIIVYLFIMNRVYKSFFESFSEILATVKNFAKANYSNLITKIDTKEVENISIEFDNLKNNLGNSISFAEEICNEKLDSNYSPVNKEDSLGKSLLRIRDNMKSAKIEQERRKIEDEKQNWLNKGLASFSDLLRLHNDDLKKHSEIIIQNLVAYIKANQGAIFVTNKDDNKGNYLELVSAYAYNTKKYIVKEIPFGEGLVGTCAIEKRTIFLKEVPENYIEITSGLGEANPRCILIVPIKIEENILGVVEIASFKVFEKHEIEFVERIMESVASTLSSARINAQTSSLLKRFELQNEQMKSQEEEMRQNMEEMLAVQEDAERTKQELESQLNALCDNILFCEYFPDGRSKKISEIFAQKLGFKLNEVSNGSIEDHLKIGFIKLDTEFFEIIDELTHNDKTQSSSNIYLVSGKEVMLEEYFIPIKDIDNTILSVIRIAEDKTSLRLKDDEITALINKERSLIEELNMAKETIKNFENN